MLENSFAQQFL